MNEPAPLHSPLIERQILRLLVEAGQTSASAPRQFATEFGLRLEDFADLRTRELVAMVLALSDEGAPSDFASLFARVRESKSLASEGRSLVMVICQDPEYAAVEAALPLYAETLRDLALRRRLVELGRRIASEASAAGADTAAILAAGHGDFAALTRSEARIKTGQDYLSDMLAELGDANSEPVLPTGIPSLDAVIGGLQPTLTLIGGLPGRGKSALLATIIQSLVGRGVKSAVFSLEDPGTWIPLRLVAQASGINQHVIRFQRKSPIQFERIQKAAHQLWDPLANVFIDDRERLTPAQVAATSIDLIVNHGVKAIFVDHFGELDLGKVTERHDLVMDSGVALLRDVAKRYKVPMVVCAHLKRRQGLEVDSIPKLTDFFGSSAFEKKARVALGLSRSDDKDAPLVITILKQTNGVPGVSINLKFVGAAALCIDDSVPEKHYSDTEPSAP